MNWNEDFKQYAVRLAMIYKTAPEDTIKCLRLGSVAGCLNESYLSLVREKEIVPIEQIAEERKVKIWKQAKSLSESKNDCILISRSIYLLQELVWGQGDE
jgi:hypothetical protein